MRVIAQFHDAREGIGGRTSDPRGGAKEVEMTFSGLLLSTPRRVAGKAAQAFGQPPLASHFVLFSLA